MCYKRHTCLGIKLALNIKSINKTSNPIQITADNNKN